MSLTPDWTVTTDDGVRLGAKVTEPAAAGHDGPVRGDVLLLHAMMVDARTLDRPPGKGLASTLASMGLRVHRADLRGRGMSERPSDWRYEDLVYQDLPALMRHFDSPPWVMTHSLGGHVTTASWATGHIAPRGLFGMASAPWLHGSEDSVRRTVEKHVAGGLLRISARAFGRLPVRRMGLGSVDEGAGYARDIARFWRTGRWTDRAGTDFSAAMRTLRGRALYVASEGDRLLGSPGPTMSWASQCPTAELLWLRDGSLGIERAPDHMGLGMSAESRPLWELAGRWMLEQASA